MTQLLVPQNLCASDLPGVVFACPTIPDEEVLGVYLPYESKSPPVCSVSRTKRYWTADLDGDGIAELAGVMKVFSGVMSDTMFDIEWYVNVRGVWHLIDWATEIDCT